ncbi:MAG: Fe2+-dependent dioxygenase [Burkholderiales bacterium]|nr:Fe2+-dependent dioxygenase [Burkholderiales bacterium]
MSPLLFDDVLSKDEVREFRTHLDAAEWHDGAATAGEMARDVKRNQQLPDEAGVAIELGNRILRVLGQHGRFTAAALPRRIFPPRFNRYADGGTYGMHVDSALMRVAGTPHTLRSDLSITLFLSEPDEYDGGTLEIAGSAGIQSVKAPAGSMVLYPSTTVHRVAPVTRGARIAAFFWVESWVRETAERELLFELDESIQALRATSADEGAAILRLTGVYHNLLRRWAIT